MKTTSLQCVTGRVGGRLRKLFRPRREMREAVASAEKSAAPPKSRPHDLSGRRILVVDDDPVVLKTTMMKLQGHGCQVFTATDASAAIGAARKHSPDLILLDIHFPPDVAHGGAVAWDGLLIMSWLKRLDHARGIPIVIISGSEQARYKERALAGGAAAFFQKPLDHEDLLDCIAGLLQAPSDPPAPCPGFSFQI